MIFDFTTLSPELQLVEAEDITFDGTLEFNFVDNNGLLVANDIIVTNKSEVTFGNVEIKKSMVLDRDLKSQGRFSFDSDSIVTLKWEKSDIPDLVFDEIPTSIPKEINLQFDGTLTSDDYLIYNQIFYNTEMKVIYGKIPCEDLLKRTKLVSEHPLFNNGTSFIELKCVNENDQQLLVMKGKSMVPIPTNLPLPTLTPLPPLQTLTPIPVDPNQGQGGGGSGAKGTTLGAGPIIGIVIACVVVVGAIIGILVYRTTRSKYEALLTQHIETEGEEKVDLPEE